MRFMRFMKSNGNSTAFWAFLSGLLTATLLLGLVGRECETDPGLDGDAAPEGSLLSLGRLMRSAGVLRQAHADLEEGDYEFFPNRRSVWVVNRTNGRMANYEVGSEGEEVVARTRVATLDLNTFPTADTTITLSDRHLSNILWICNRRTGDVEMWRPTRDRSLQRSGPFVTGADLASRPAPAGR